MEIKEKSVLDGSIQNSEPDTFTSDYLWGVVIHQAGNISLDISRIVLESYRRQHLKTQLPGLTKRIGEHIICPKCCVPWVAGYNKPRLLKLNKKKLLLKNSDDTQSNMLKLFCEICKNKINWYCKKKMKDSAKLVQMERCKKKIKRRKGKGEINAGLKIPVSIDRSSSKYTFPMKLCDSALTDNDKNYCRFNKSKNIVNVPSLSHISSTRLNKSSSYINNVNGEVCQVDTRAAKFKNSKLGSSLKVLSQANKSRLGKHLDKKKDVMNVPTHKLPFLREALARADMQKPKLLASFLESLF